MSMYTIGDYLLDRLSELGVSEIFGVPGDYNLRFLDHIVNHDHLRWVGNANELNAGYAADAYARMRGIAALVTTYGVSELSAINATAGSYAELLPVIHIVGAPSKAIQAAGLKVHHSLADGDFNHFIRMASEVSSAVANLEVANATWEVDRVLRTAMYERRPGYILLAADVAATPTQPPTEPLNLIQPVSVPAVEEKFEQAARDFLAGRKATILADLYVHRLGAWDQLTKLLEETQLPVATLSWGKSLVDESSAAYLGTYTGAASEESTRRAVEEAEALITLGVEFTDNTTAGFSTNIDDSRRINVHRGQAHIGNQAFTPLPLGRAIEILSGVIKDLGVTGMDIPGSNVSPGAVAVEKRGAAEPTADPLTQEQLWSQVAAALDGEYIVLAEQGCSFFGLADARLPKGTMFIGQPQWGSIGYTLPATLGAGLAAPGRRPVLFIGDGAAQLTIQEIGQLIREKVPAVIVLINNDGYTVERAIHGPEDIYNDIPRWNWQMTLPYFGAAEGTYLSMQARNGIELHDALVRAKDNKDKLVFLEVVTGRMDVPEALATLAARL